MVECESRANELRDEFKEEIEDIEFKVIKIDDLL